MTPRAWRVIPRCLPDFPGAVMASGLFSGAYQEFGHAGRIASRGDPGSLYGVHAPAYDMSLSQP